MGSIPIKVSPETKRKLDERRHAGQTYDGIIRELLEKAEEKERIEQKEKA